MIVWPGGSGSVACSALMCITWVGGSPAITIYRFWSWHRLHLCPLVPSAQGVGGFTAWLCPDWGVGAYHGGCRLGGAWWRVGARPWGTPVTSSPHIVNSYPWSSGGRRRVAPYQFVGWRSRGSPCRGRMLLLVPFTPLARHYLPVGSRGGGMGEVTVTWACGGHHGLQQWRATQGGRRSACVLSAEIGMTSTEGEGLFQIFVSVWGLSGPVLCGLGALGHCGPAWGVHSLGTTRTNTSWAIGSLGFKG